MKIFVILLSVCIFILSCITCEDFTALKDNIQTQNFSSVKKTQDHSNADNCSPLCTCNCCGQPLAFILKSSSLNILKSEEINSNQAEYKNSFTSAFLTNIWQPPKIEMNING